MTMGMGMGGGMLRRLPVYLLLDCSSSMTGQPIIAVNEGLEMLYRELMRDPQARETAWISLIRFASQAAQDALMPIDQFVPPVLAASGGTAMGGAFNLLYQSISQDLQAAAGQKKADFCPLVFLLTDGQPGDEWRSPAANLHSLRGPQRPTIVALGCGPGADPAMLAEVASKDKQGNPLVYIMGVVTADELKAFFKLISGSIIRNSQAAVPGGELITPPLQNISGVDQYQP